MICWGIFYLNHCGVCGLLDRAREEAGIPLYEPINLLRSNNLGCLTALSNSYGRYNDIYLITPRGVTIPLRVIT